MKKLSIIGIISFLADIVTLTSLLKSFLINILGIGEDYAIGINCLVFVISTIILLCSLSFLYLNKKLINAGTHSIPCALVPYIRYKYKNKICTILRGLHRELYHKIHKLKKDIFTRKQRNAEMEHPQPLTPNDFEESIKNLLSAFHDTLYDIFKVDMSISVFLISRINDNDYILTRGFFQPSKREDQKAEQRPEIQYIINDGGNQSTTFYATSAEAYATRRQAGQYKKNSIFDYILSSSAKSWLSNNLDIDMANKKFYSSSPNYGKYYSSLGAFAIAPPCRGNTPNAAIKGILTFDSHKTNIFSEEEFTLLMGLMAHIMYEVLDCLN